MGVGTYNNAGIGHGIGTCSNAGVGIGIDARGGSGITVSTCADEVRQRCGGRLRQRNTTHVTPVDRGRAGRRCGERHGRRYQGD